MRRIEAKEPFQHSDGITGRQFVLAVSALFIPAAYVVGVSYHDAYFESFGLAPSLFPIGVEQTLYSAYLALVVPLVSSSLGFLGGGGLALIVMSWFVVLLAVLVAPRIGSSLAAVIRGAFPRVSGWLGRYSLFRAAQRTHKLATAPLWAILFLAYVPFYGYVPAYVGYLSGRSAGEARLRGLMSGSGMPAFSIVAGGSVVPGIECGDLGCAGFKGGFARFYKWEQIGSVYGQVAKR